MIRAAKYLLTVLVVVFMVVIYLSGATPTTPMATLAERIAACEPTAALEAENDQQVVRFLGLYPEEYAELHYWKSTDGMNATEVVVAEALSDNSVSVLKKAFEQRVADQLGAFEGYAPEQEAKLKSYVLKQRGRYLLYAVGSTEEVSAWTAVFDGIQ